MKVPFTISDFLYRAENVYSDRIALVDEPGMPGGGLGEFMGQHFEEKWEPSDSAFNRNELEVWETFRNTRIDEVADLILGSFGPRPCLCPH